MDIVFRDKYVTYDQISDVSLMEINDVLVENDIYIELDDKSINDWGGYAYYYCKSLHQLDEQTTCSFVYIITWFMTGDAIDINPKIKSNKYYKNSMIMTKCLGIYSFLSKGNYSEIELCKHLFEDIYDFYVYNHEDYIKKSEKINCVLTYKDLELFNKVNGNTYGEIISILLDNYYNHT